MCDFTLGSTQTVTLLSKITCCFVENYLANSEQAYITFKAKFQVQWVIRGYRETIHIHCAISQIKYLLINFLHVIHPWVYNIQKNNNKCIHVKTQIVTMNVAIIKQCVKYLCVSVTYMCNKSENGSFSRCSITTLPCCHRNPLMIDIQGDKIISKKARI